MIYFNDTVTFAWKQFHDLPTFTQDQLIQALLTEYDIDLPTATESAQYILSQWRQSGLLLE